MILLVHLGGLGDVCLSESLFFSLSHHFRELVGLGYKRYLELFHQYFSSIESVETTRWLYLFGSGEGPCFERVVLVGKDRSGLLRGSLKRFSREPILFIEMYPDFPMHVEEYQLLKLSQYGIPARRKGIPLRRAKRVILYPEVGFRKSKWGIDRFLAVYEELKRRGIEVVFLRPVEMAVSLPSSVYFEDLKDVMRFLGAGGIFVSNDCGMAHLASVCGLFSITIFFEYDPSIWHPRGHNLSLSGKGLRPEDVVERVLEKYELMDGSVGEYDPDHLQLCLLRNK